MSPIRTYVQSLDPESLAELWAESDHWEDTGSLPANASVREHLKLSLPDVHDLLSFTIWATQFFAEVWRECAVRGLRCPDCRTTNEMRIT